VLDDRDAVEVLEGHVVVRVRFYVNRPVSYWPMGELRAARYSFDF
jgi:hypothetical protein